MLVMPSRAFAEMIGHAYDGYPLEACGLLVGRGDQVERFVACTNEAASARIYTIPAKELLRPSARRTTTGWRSSACSTATPTASRTRARPTSSRRRIPIGTT